MPIPSVTGFSNMVHHHLPNTAFAIVEEVYQRLPELMNLRDMLYALDKKPEFFTNAFKCSNYYGISFKEEYLDTLGYNPKSIKDMQILATHIMGDSSYTRFYYKDTIEVPNQDGTVSYLVYTFLLPKIRDISKFKVYSKDRNISREITVDSNNIFVVDATTVQGLTLTTEQTFTEILPAINSTVVTGGSGESSSTQPSTPSTPVELPENIVTYVPMNDREEVLDNTDGSINNSWNSYLAELQYPNSTPTEMGTTQVYGISFMEPYHSDIYATTYNLPFHPVGLVNAYTDLYYLTCNGEILLNLSDVITTGNFESTLANYSSNFLTSSDLPDMSDYVETSEVANEAGKIPRFNNQGHLVLPDGTELWCENE